MKRLHNPSLNLLLPAWRSTLVAVLLAAMFIALIFRALYLQTIRTDFLQDQGEARYARTLKLEASRGQIVDRNGELLASSDRVEAIWASPADVVKSLEEPYRQKGLAVPAELTKKPLWSEEQLRALGDTLGVPASELQRKLADRKSNFVYLKRQLEPEVARRVDELRLPGIYRMGESKRFYPYSETMAHLLGYVGVDGNGQEGVELAFDRQLSGTPGSRRVLMDRRGHIIDDLVHAQRPKDGQVLQLSIDRNLQSLAYRELARAVTQHKARAGGIVVLDARTGEVLALANLPSYNPNNRMSVDPANRRNRALTDTFEPGSTMKPFAAAAALEAGRVTPDTVLGTNGGRLTMGPNTIHDSHGHGALTVTQIIQVSSNVGAAKLALMFSPEEYWQILSNCGFGRSTKSGFPGEVNARLRPWKDWVPIDQATMAYGHGMSVTLLQLAQAYTVFTHNGQLQPVSIIKQVAPPEGRRVFSPLVAEQLRSMLEKVTQPGGTALRARVLGYRVGGKTGTALKLEGGRYVKKYVGSFVGFAPVSNPRLIVAVMIDEPTAGQYYGGTVAAPVFSTVMGEALRMLGVPPDAPAETIVQPSPEDDKAAEVF